MLANHLHGFGCCGPYAQGQLPNEWGDSDAFPALTFLRLSFNHASGSLPGAWGVPGAFPRLKWVSDLYLLACMRGCITCTMHRLAPATGCAMKPAEQHFAAGSLVSAASISNRHVTAPRARGVAAH